MLQSVLLFLAPGQKIPVIPCTEPVRVPRTATRSAARLTGKWWRRMASGLVVISNAVGLLLFFAGLGLVLRLVEVLLA